VLAAKPGFDDSLALCHRAESEEGNSGDRSLATVPVPHPPRSRAGLDVTASQLDAKKPGQPARFSYVQKLKNSMQRRGGFGLEEEISLFFLG
jgi:hypothetical protein